MTDQHRLFIRFLDQATADTWLATKGYATYPAANSEPTTVAVGMRANFEGMSTGIFHEMTFTAAQLLALTTPAVFNEPVLHEWPPILTGSTNMDFTVDNVSQVTNADRTKDVQFTVQPDSGSAQRFHVRDDGGKVMEPASDVTIEDFNQVLGWPLVEQARLSDADGNETRPSKRAVGTYFILTLTGQPYDDDLRPIPADQTLFELSVLAADAKDNGVRKTQGARAADTDFGDYTMIYWEISGAGIIDPTTIPDNWFTDRGATTSIGHGRLNGLTGRS